MSLCVSEGSLTQAGLVVGEVSRDGHGGAESGSSGDQLGELHGDGVDVVE